jgi:hypothetical protein
MPSTIRPSITVTPSTFDVDLVTVGEYTESKYNTSQKVGYIKYKDCNLLIQTPELKCYGVPQANQLYYKTDKDRLHIKIPEDISDPRCVMLFKKLEELDEMFDNNKFKIESFGKLAQSYRYSPIVKTPQKDDEDVNDNNKDKPRYIKVKINSDFETDKILTNVFVKEGSERVPVADIVDIDDMSQYIRYNSTIKALISIDKSYMMKSKMGNTSFRLYGITLRLKQVLCDPVTFKRDNATDDQFVDDDTD